MVAIPRDTYTHGHHSSVLRSHAARTAENSAGYLLPRLKPGMNLLDVGCGPGSITLDLARLVAPGVVIGIDNAEEPLKVARTAAGAADVENIEFRVGDVYSLGFPGGSFDVVHAHQVLQHLSRPVTALREMGRVCRPGGVVAARDADYGAMTWYPDSAGLSRWLQLYRAVARGNRAEPDAGRRLLSWARQSGFARVASSASVWHFTTPEERAAWGSTWAERVTGSAFAAQAIDRGLTSNTELAEIARAWREWTQQPDAWFVVLHGEILCEVGAG